MEDHQLKEIATYFAPGESVINAREIGSGHIHKTYKIGFEGYRAIILQQVNTTIFRKPDLIIQNILKVSNHLKSTAYPYRILEPLAGHSGFLKADEAGSWWRAFPFIENTFTTDSVASPFHAYEAAKAFSCFLKGLSGMDAGSIGETVPDFHNLDLRYEEFIKLSEQYRPGNRKAASEIEKIRYWKNEFRFDFESLPIRVVHNDTKINNVLLDNETKKAVCVIDLDTIMPGWAVTDFGDMIRTFCCTADENETDLDKVEIDLVIFESMSKGFLEYARHWLSKLEIAHLVNGGMYIILEQAIRFLADHLQGDRYYPVSYPDQNFDRAKNQLKLLQSLVENADNLKLIINRLTM